MRATMVPLLFAEPSPTCNVFAEARERARSGVLYAKAPLVNLTTPAEFMYKPLASRFVRSPTSPKPGDLKTPALEANASVAPPAPCHVCKFPLCPAPARTTSEVEPVVGV